MNAGIVGRVKGSGGKYRIHRWLPEGDYLVACPEYPGAVQPGLIAKEEPSVKHPACGICFPSGRCSNGDDCSRGDLEADNS